MPKLIILYNLRDDVTVEDFAKWVNEYKGPFIAGLSAVKSYTVTKVMGAMKGEGSLPGPVESPYQIAAIVDVTSPEDYAKNQESDAYKTEFMPQFMKWTKNVMILKGGEIFHKSKG